MSNIPGYLTAQEAADMLGVDRSQVSRYCLEEDEQYRLPAIKIGQQWLIKKKDVDKFKPRPRGNPAFQRSA